MVWIFLILCMLNNVWFILDISYFVSLNDVICILFFLFKGILFRFAVKLLADLLHCFLLILTLLERDRLALLWGPLTLHSFLLFHNLLHGFIYQLLTKLHILSFKFTKPAVHTLGFFFLPHSLAGATKQKWRVIVELSSLHSFFPQISVLYCLFYYAWKSLLYILHNFLCYLFWESKFGSSYYIMIENIILPFFLLKHTASSMYCL